jgi:hypothetical protein
MGVFEYKAEIPNTDGTVEDVTLTFNDIALLPIGVARANRSNAEDQMWATFEWGLSADDLEVFDRIPQPQLPEIYKAWRESEGIDSGESSASSASSTDTVKPLRRTSSATDSD